MDDKKVKQKPEILLPLISQEFGMTEEMLQQMFDPEKFDIVVEK